MSRHQTRLLFCACVALGLILVSALGMAWFTLRIEGLEVGGMGIDGARIDLRSISMCDHNGACVSLPFSKIDGFYPTMSLVTFWSSLVLSILVAVQTGARVVRGVAGDGITRIGYFVGVVCLAAAVMAGFMFSPETHASGNIGVHVVRSWTPIMMLAGVVIALYTLRLAVADDLGPLEPSLPVATMRGAAIPDRGPYAPPAPAEPPPLQGKLRYVAATVEISRAGLDARREDRVAKLVLWSDVVRVVARRLPAAAPYDGETFVDLVSSSPGSTLRIMAWTRLTGDVPAGEGVDLARAIVRLVASRCPAAQLDRATRRFLDGQGQAAQLPDIAALDGHDELLARAEDPTGSPSAS